MPCVDMVIAKLLEPGDPSAVPPLLMRMFNQMKKKIEEMQLQQRVIEFRMKESARDSEFQYWHCCWQGEHQYARQQVESALLPHAEAL